MSGKIELIGPNKEIMELTNELLSQNRMILESNISMLEIINNPTYHIMEEDDK
jgi:hypothetical protein